MDFLEIIAEKFRDHVFSTLKESLEIFKGQRDDILLGNTVRQQLLERYGKEPFYDALDAYISGNKTIDHLIYFMRNFTVEQTMGPTDFVNKHCKELLNNTPTCLAYSSQIEEVFVHVFFWVFFAVTDVNPYSDIGRLKSSVLLGDTEIINILQKHGEDLKSIKNYIAPNQEPPNDNPLKAKKGVLELGAENLPVVNSLRADNRVYLKAFYEPLFLEPSSAEDRQALLKDVYIPPKYKIAVFGGPKRVQVFEMLKDFFCNRENFTIHQDKAFPVISERVFAIMLIGRPGIGKSSFVSYLTTKEQEFTQGRSFYVIRLRNMQFQQINTDDPIQGLLQYLRIKENELDNSILVLDGLDEICAIYNKTDFQTYLARLLHNLSSIPKLQVVLTSRTGYFRINDAIKDVCLVVNIENWDNGDLDSWSESYSSIHPEKGETIKRNKEHLQTEKYSDKKAIFAIPILFYMANARGELLEKHSSICSVYDSVLTEVAGERHYDSENTFFTGELIDPRLARQICREIAFSMFRNGRLSMYENSVTVDPFLLPDEVECAVSEAIELCEVPHKILNAEDKEKIKHYYALTFYYNKDHTENNAVEFAHKTIAEYFTAEKLLELLSSITSNSSEEEFGEILAECFCYMPVTNDILIFVNEKLKIRNDSPEMTLLRDKLSSYLVNGALSGSLFAKPKHYKSELHYLDRAVIMLKSSLILFEYLQCNPAKEYSAGSAAFDNILATISRSVAINPQHATLLPLCLNGFVLRDGNFVSGDFSEAHMSGADLSHTDFSDAKLTDAQMSRSNISVANFSSADLSGADLTHITGDTVDFTEAILQGADLSDSSFVNTSFDYAELQEADLTYCIFGEGCHFKNAIFYGANLDYADISRANIEDSVFDKEDDDEDDGDEKYIISHLRLTAEQHSYLSEFLHVELVDPCIVNKDKSENP